jgi:hypothetical protein
MGLVCASSSEIAKDRQPNRKRRPGSTKINRAKIRDLRFPCAEWEEHWAAVGSRGREQSTVARGRQEWRFCDPRYSSPSGPKRRPAISKRWRLMGNMPATLTAGPGDRGGCDGVCWTADDRRVYLRLANEMNGNRHPLVRNAAQDYMALCRSCPTSSGCRHRRAVGLRFLSVWLPQHLRLLAHRTRCSTCAERANKRFSAAVVAHPAIQSNIAKAEHYSTQQGRSTL